MPKAGRALVKERTMSVAPRRRRRGRSASSLRALLPLASGWRRSSRTTWNLGLPSSTPLPPPFPSDVVRLEKANSCREVGDWEGRTEMVWTWLAGDRSIHSVAERRFATVRPPAASAGVGRMRRDGGRRRKMLDGLYTSYGGDSLSLERKLSEPPSSQVRLCSTLA